MQDVGRSSSPPFNVHIDPVQELSPVSVSVLCCSAVDRQPDGSSVPSSRMHAVTLDSLRVSSYAV